MKAIQKNHQTTTESGAAEENPPAGLRERQKLARTERILSGASALFNRQGFEDTTMAAIASNAEVSTPTVFNYFKTKEELLLALVLQVHHETRKRVQDYRPKASSSVSGAICEFLEMYSRKSLESINRKTWRHVESTRIRLPDSDFVRKYDALAQEMLTDFQRFLAHVIEDEQRPPGETVEVVAEILFNHWSALFIELIRDETMTIDDHVKRLCADLSILLETMKISD